MMTSLWKNITLTFVTSVLLLTPNVQAKDVYIKNAHIHTMVAGAAAVQEGEILVRDGKIVAIGRNLAQSEDTSDMEHIDAAGHIVTPGLIAPWSQLGLVEISLDHEANDSSTQDAFALGAALDAVDAFNPSTTLIPINRTGGVTRALSAPMPGDKMFGGRAAIVDLSGTEKSVMQARAAQSLVLGYGGAQRNGDSRLAAIAVLRETLYEARAYAADPGSFLRRHIADRMEIADLDALRPVVQGDQLLIVRVDSATDIRSVIRIKREFELNVAVLGGSEAWRVGTLLVDEGIPVIVDPLLNLPTQFEDMGATLSNAARLYESGVTIAFFGGDHTTHNLRRLPQLAGNAVAHGLPYQEGLASLTRNAAQILGISDQLGTLEPGKIADIVIWSGDPLEVTTHPMMVLIEGEVQSLENRQTILRDRYKDLSRGSLPFAYR